MAINHPLARKICSAKELKLVQLVRADELKKTPESKIKKAITQTRLLRDKFKDLSRRQKALNKRTRGGTDNALRSQQKAKLFAEVLTHLEKGLKKKHQVEKARSQTRHAKSRRHGSRVATKTQESTQKAAKKKGMTLSKAISQAPKKKTASKVAQKVGAKKKVKKTSAVPTKGRKTPASLLAALELKKEEVRSRASNEAAQGSRISAHFKNTPMTRIRSHQRSANRKQQIGRNLRKV